MVQVGRWVGGLAVNCRRKKSLACEARLSGGIDYSVGLTFRPRQW